MAEIPEAAVEAALEAWVLYADDRSFTGKGLATVMLEAAERAWPHKAPARDPHSTLASDVSFGPRWDYDNKQKPASKRPFGFGVTKL